MYTLHCCSNRQRWNPSMLGKMVKNTMCMYFEKRNSGFWMSDVENTCTTKEANLTQVQEELKENQQVWVNTALDPVISNSSMLGQNYIRLYEKWEMLQIGGGLVERAKPMCTLVQQDFFSICCQCLLMSSSPAQVWSVWFARDVVPTMDICPSNSQFNVFPIPRSVQSLQQVLHTKDVTQQATQDTYEEEWVHSYRRQPVSLTH